MRIIRISLLSAVLAATGGCGSLERSDSEETTRKAIIGGTRSTDADFVAVGAILTRGYVMQGNPPTRRRIGGMICSATLIAEDVILTAAHCTEIAQEFYSNVGEDIENYFSLHNDVRGFGGRFDLPPSSYLIGSFVVPPAYDRANFDLFPAGLAELSDIGLGFLATTATSAEPVMTLEPESSDVLSLGANVDIVGYGKITGNGGVGVQAQAISMINEINTTEMQIGDAPPTPVQCFGDSGGPAFMTVEDGREPALRIIGVTSRSYDDTNCAKGGIDMRVDAFRAWLEMHMIAACNDGTRVHCENGGALPIPREPGSDDAGFVADAGHIAADAGVPSEGTGTDGGCGCRTDRTSGTGSLFVLALIGLFVSSRRRSTNPRHTE